MDSIGAGDGGLSVGDGFEVFRSDGIYEQPGVGVAGTVGVGVAVCHGAVSVGGDIHKRIVRIRHGSDLASAGIGDRLGSGLDGLVRAVHDVGSVLRDNKSGQFDGVGVGPHL